jgi:signal transduction histidine kinase
MNLHTPRLKWKIFFFLLGFCFLLLIVLWFFQTILLDTFYRQVRILEIRRSTTQIISNAGNENINEIIRNISDNNEIVVEITDLSGRSLLSSSPLPSRFREENAMFIAAALGHRGEFYEYSISQGNRMVFNTERDMPVTARRPSMQTLVYVRIANNSMGEPFAVIVRAIISPVSATVTTLRYQLYFISGILFLFAVILSIIIAKRVAKPIEEISQSAMLLAGGKYDTHFTGKGYHEIDVLSNTLNTAALELSRVENLRRELLANISHDLRTPLALVSSYTEMMLDFPEEIKPEQLQAIMDETKRLTTLVNDILDVSKLENTMGNFNSSRYNLTQSILEIIENNKKLMIKEGFDFSFSHNNDIYVHADKAKIDRAFYNLLINAINYSGENRRIFIEQTVNGSYVRISVIDRGEGIANNDLPYIWDRYYKSRKTHIRAITGSGLGLSIVKKIIDMHDGKYGITSEEGKGSTFWFELKTF